MRCAARPETKRAADVVLSGHVVLTRSTHCVLARAHSCTRQALPEKPKPLHTAETDSVSSAAAEPVQPPMEGSPILEVALHAG